MTEAQPSLTERRIRDAQSARSMYTKLRLGSDSRRKEQATVINQVNGGKPFSDAQLRELGQAWRTNCNFRDAGSMLEQALIAYWRLLHDSTNYAAVTVHGDSGQEERWASIFQTAFNRFFEDWGPDYVYQYLLLSLQHVAHGIGTAVWNDPKSPRWEAITIGDVDVPEKSKANVERIPLVAIRHTYEVDELYAYVRDGNAESSQKVGWNVAEVRKVLTKAIKGENAKEEDWLDVASSLRDNSLASGYENTRVTVVNLLVKEYDGKISHLMFCPDLEHDDFLFDDSGVPSRPTSLAQKLAFIFFDVGDGRFWGVKGFAAKNFQLATILNRLKSRAVDRTLLDGLNFRDMTEGVRDVVPITNIGPINILPKDLEQIPQYPSGQVSLETIGLFDSQMSFNNARYRDQSRQLANTNTATQATILANLQSQVDVANATLYLTQIARNLFVEQFRRLRQDSDDPDAVKFRKRCVDLGMDKEVFKNAEISVRTGSDPGAASIALQAQFANEFLALGADPNVNRRWFLERKVAAQFGAQAVSHALNRPDALGDVAAQRAALMENSDMGEGNPLPVAISDNHREHIPIHLQPLQVIVDQYKATGRMDPNAIIALQIGIPHAEQHLAMIEGDKSYDDVRKQFAPVLSTIKSQAAGIFRQLERMQSEAAGGPPQGGFDPAGMVGAVTQQ